MVGRKLFKTRICVLYKQGHCHRQTCSFAHGDAELRRYNTSSYSSFSGRRDYHGADLRDKLGRHRSPHRRDSLDRDARDGLPSRGLGTPRRGKKSDWTNKKRRHFDGESDGSLRISDGAQHKARDRKPSSSESKAVHDEQMKQVQSEIDMLEDHKQQLQIYLEERVQEADSLNSKIKELEMQLSLEKEECKRISSKIRKFIKANNRHSRIQEELKRSQARLQRLGDQLGSDATAAADEEDININILTDEETLGNHLMIPKNDKASPSKEQTLGNHLTSPQKDQHKASPSKKRLRVHMVEADEKSKQASSATGEWLAMEKPRSERHSRWDTHLSRRNTKEMRADANGINNSRPLVNDGKPVGRKSSFTGIPLADKFKDSPSTRMGVNVVDEVVESDDKLESQETASVRAEEGSAVDNTALPFPLPPPPVVRNAYVQYKGEDENVDVVDDDDEMLDVDIV